MIFGRLLGHNILAAEPLNLFYYLAILICIYFLGREVFDAQTGFFAAAIVAVWPTFLLHSTQLMRDPLSISCLLALMLVLTLVLSREFAWRKGISIGIAGAMLVTLFWLARGNMWNVVIVAIAITLAMLVCRMIRAKRFMRGNAFVMLLIVAACSSFRRVWKARRLPGVRPPLTPLAIPRQRCRNRCPDRRRRLPFVSTSQASDIDEECNFQSTGDVVKFMPRAFVIGFFAPFPNMWVEAGSFGRAPRVVSGLETLAMYFVYFAVGLCVWRERRNLKMWLLFLVATIGMLALGLVVVNAGALFRIRYAFWMLMIVIAGEPRIIDRINMICNLNLVNPV